MAYSRGVVFVETEVFTKQITELLQDEEYRELQQALVFNPGVGDVIRNSGGLRKVRWRTTSKGKRGGIRVIYYWFIRENEIYMLLAYGKSRKDDLTSRELGLLRRIMGEVVS